MARERQIMTGRPWPKGDGFNAFGYPVTLAREAGSCA
jgi:hypothetical protein